ncbi:MAG: DinB family protein [Boseongicola sp.]|nr:DinB family protein [Boseongicola sp.]MDD9978046.1 DinB family protein [Boseongicola sp.]
MSTTSENPWLKMALNNAWANSTLYGVLTTLDADAFTAERPGFFPSLARTMNHIYEVDLFYLDALGNGGLGRSVYNREDVNEPAHLAALQSEADMRFAAFCNAITPETLAATRVTARDSGPVKENVAALLLHLVQHQIHHRGQAHVQLQHAGIEPPQLDDFYLEFGRVESAKPYWG